MLITVEVVVDNVRVEVDVDVGSGEPCTVVIGVAESQAREMMRRVELAITALGYRLPTGRTIIALKPNVEKHTPALDAAIVHGLLRAIGQVQ
jgi:predicted ATPase with chaperone activity